MDAKCILFVLNYGMLQFRFSRMIIPQWTTFSFLIYCTKLSYCKIYIVRLVSDENKRFAKETDVASLRDCPGTFLTEI